LGDTIHGNPVQPQNLLVKVKDVLGNPLYSWGIQYMEIQTSLKFSGEI
jgi:hypothetical protein